jgi:hypothetical protein
MNTILRLAAVLIAAAVATTSADAGFIQNSYGLSSPAQLITFEEHVLAGNTALSNQYSAEGVTFTGMTYSPEDLSGFGYSHIVGHDAGNFPPVENPFSIHFVTPTSAAAFALISNPGELTTFEAYMAGVLQESSGPIATSSFDPDNFYGFSGFLFDEIRISSDAAVNGALTIDFLQFGTTAAAVPEPSSIILLGIATPGFAWIASRRPRRR